MRAFSIEFLTRSGCHLCTAAEPVVRRVAKLTGARLVVTDIESDAELAVDWGMRIPVIRGPDGTVLGEGIVGFGRLLRAVAAARLSASRRLHRA